MARPQQEEESKTSNNDDGYSFIEIDDVMEKPGTRWLKKANTKVGLKRGLMEFMA